jgi:acetyltransferase-like isoleucine patch superfamily enzyme
MSIYNLLRFAALGIALLIAGPLYAIYRFLGFFVGKNRVFPGFSQFLSLFPGILGQFLRRGFYILALKKCSTQFTIDFGTFFPTDNVIIGRNVYIGAHCIISSCIIDDDVIIGSGVHLANKSMHFFDKLDKPIRLQGGDRRQIHIGNDCWIGNKALVMANIGRQCVIGAGSVVTKSIAAQSIAVGNPACVIRKRSELLLSMESDLD